MRITILGGGRSGIAAALLAKKHQYQVWVSDAQTIPLQHKQLLQKHLIPYEEHQHSINKILKSDFVIKSPGIYPSSPIVQTLKKAGIPIYSEIEFASRFIPPKQIIAVTGTVGKTTVVTFLAQLYNHIGKTAVACGNIGYPLSQAVLENPNRLFIVEVSSFQLEDTQTFHPHTAIITNLSPHHLDYHGSLSDYLAAKWKITQRQTSEDWFIYNLDCALTVSLLEQWGTKAQCFGFSLHYHPKAHAWLDKEFNLHTAMDKKDKKMPEVKVTGPFKHHALIAGILSQRDEIRRKDIRETLTSFEEYPHRLEVVGVYDQITYVNDSKATTVAATYYALQQFPKPIVWIAGGQFKGQSSDLEKLIPLVKEKVSTLILIGEDNHLMKSTFRPYVSRVIEAKSMYDAVRKARQNAVKGSTVLLSPACASFDRFENYEDRGNRFKAAVEKLCKIV